MIPFRKSKIDISELKRQFDASRDALDMKGSLLEYAAEKADKALADIPEMQECVSLHIDPESLNAYLEWDPESGDSSTLVFSDTNFILSLKVKLCDTEKEIYSMYAEPFRLFCTENGGQYYNFKEKQWEEKSILDEKSLHDLNDLEMDIAVKSDPRLMKIAQEQSVEGSFARLVAASAFSTYEEYLECLEANKNLVELSRHLNGLVDFDRLIPDYDIPVDETSSNFRVSLVPDDPKTTGLSVVFENGEFRLYQYLCVYDRCDSEQNFSDSDDKTKDWDNEEWSEDEYWDDLDFDNEDLICRLVDSTTSLQTAEDNLHFLLDHYTKHPAFYFPLSWEAYACCRVDEKDFDIHMSGRKRSLTQMEKENLNYLKKAIKRFDPKSMGIS